MHITRTANAGVLLELDGVKILLDGVCRAGEVYLGTPDSLRARLEQQAPDVVAVTHAHEDHFDAVYAAFYARAAGRRVLTPDTAEPAKAGDVTVTPVPSRHIGGAGKTVAHVSYVVKGSQTVWFMGDAAPTQWRGKNLPKPDVIIAPYAYANTPTSWAATQSFGVKDVVLVHLPDRESDPYGLWDAVLAATAGAQATRLHIPAVGETIALP